MFRTLFLVAAFGAALVGQVRELDAAQVTCLQSYPAEPMPEDRAKRQWPSGYRPSKGACWAALIRGKIETGDFERFRDFYREHHRALHMVYLVSPGGDVDAAMSIGRLLRKYLVQVFAPTRHPTRQGLLQVLPGPLMSGSPVVYLCRDPTCVCASACALVLFGAVVRQGTVGLHRPRITDPEFSSLPASEATTLYRRVLQLISHYLEEMEVPHHLVDAMLATGSSDIRWVDIGTDAPNHPPSFAEWLEASCGSISANERFEFLIFMVRKTQPGAQQLTQVEELLFEGLRRKLDKYDNCTELLLRASRDRLPAP